MFQIFKALEPSDAARQGSLYTLDQLQLLHLMQSAKTQTFTEKLQSIILKPDGPKTLKDLLEQFRKMLSTSSGMTLDENREMLEEHSRPETNGLLWKQLEPQVMLDLVFKQGEGKEVNEHLLRNCSEAQIDSMLKLMPEADAHRIEFTMLKMSKGHLQRDIPELKHEAKQTNLNTEATEIKHQVGTSKVDLYGTGGKQRIALYAA